MRTDVEAITDFKPFRLLKNVVDMDKPPGGYPMLHPGDLVWWDDPITSFGMQYSNKHFGRVYGLIRKRERPKTRTGEICVILLNDSGDVCERWITKDQIYKVCRATSQVTLSLQWLFSKRFIDTPEALARDCLSKAGWELVRSIPRDLEHTFHEENETIRKGKIASQRMRAKWIRKQVKPEVQS